MRVEILKVLVLFTLLVTTFLLGMLPVLLLKLFKRRTHEFHNHLRYKRAISFLSCYAAGVFIATCLLDLLPSVRVDLSLTLNQMGIFTSFPLAEFIMMFGVFVVLIVEQIVLTIKERNTVDGPEPADITTPLLDDTTRRSYSHSIDSQHSISGISDEPFPVSFKGTRQHCDSCEERISVGNNSAINEDDDLHPEHEHSSLRSLILLTALSLHSIFEGLAVGLQKKSDDVISIFAALVIHKSIVSFSLGMNVIQSKLSHAAIIRAIVFFSIMSPAGIAIGIGIIDLWDTSTSNLVQSMLSGIACGTFLYVTFFEVLPSEFNSPDQRLLKVLFLILGFSTITGVLFLDNDKETTCYLAPNPP